jgi:hypothetical protein
MPYYVCMRGDSDHVAIDRPSAFVVEDVRERNWICVEGDPAIGEVSLLFELRKVQAKAHEQEFAQQGDKVVSFTCAREELRQLLGEVVDPDEDSTETALGSLPYRRSHPSLHNPPGAPAVPGGCRLTNPRRPLLRRRPRVGEGPPDHRRAYRRPQDPMWGVAGRAPGQRSGGLFAQGGLPAQGGHTYDGEELPVPATRNREGGWKWVLLLCELGPPVWSGSHWSSG